MGLVSEWCERPGRIGATAREAPDPVGLGGGIAQKLQTTDYESRGLAAGGCGRGSGARGGGFGVRAHLRRGWSGRSSRVTQTVARFAWMGRDEARGSARRSGALGELSGRTSSTAVSSDERARGSVRTSRGRAGSRNPTRVSDVAIKPRASRFFALRKGVASPPPCALRGRRSSDHLVLFPECRPKEFAGIDGLSKLFKYVWASSRIL